MLQPAAAASYAARIGGDVGAYVASDVLRRVNVNASTGGLNAGSKAAPVPSFAAAAYASMVRAREARQAKQGYGATRDGAPAMPHTVPTHNNPTVPTRDNPGVRDQWCCKRDQYNTCVRHEGRARDSPSRRAHVATHATQRTQKRLPLGYYQYGTGPIMTPRRAVRRRRTGRSLARLPRPDATGQHHPFAIVRVLPHVLC